MAVRLLAVADACARMFPLEIIVEEVPEDVRVNNAKARITRPESVLVSEKDPWN